MKRIIHAVLFALPLLMLQCSKPAGSPAKGATSLLAQGIPLQVRMPQGASIQRRTAGNITEVTIKGKDEDAWFEMTVQNLPAESDDLAWNKHLQLEDVKANIFFTRIMEEDENGFIYEQVPQDKATYHFRYVVVQGLQLYVFSSALGSNLSLEKARELMVAVQQ